MTTTIKSNSGSYRINANLARASFKRVGSHLKIILEDESEILLEDYYSHDSPAIVDPGGNAYNPQASAANAYTPLSETNILNETHLNSLDGLDSLGGLIHLDGLDRSPSASLSALESDFFSTFSAPAQAEQSTFQAQALAPELPDIRINVSESDSQAAHAIPPGWTVIEGGTGAYGHVEQQDGAWVFVLDRPYDHEPVQGRNLAQGADSVRVLMADPAGGVRYVGIPVSIEDDIPTQSESESLIQLPEIVPQGDFFPLSIAGQEARGNIRTDLAGDITFTPGADGARFIWGDGEPDSQGNFAPLVGQFGTLIGNVDGSYIYINNQDAAQGLIPGEIGKDTFAVRYQDADGDYVAHALTVARTGLDDPITILSKDEALTVWESALPEGTDPDPARLAASGAIRFSAPDGITKITLTTTATGTHELDLDGGECRIETAAWTAIFRRSALGEITYEFQLTGPVHHDVNPDVFYQDFNIALHDRSGTQLKGIKIPLAIMNDSPLAPDPLSYEISDSGISGSLMDHIQAGADGAGGFFNWEKRPDLAAYGSWTTDRQGNFSFEPDHSLPAFLALKPGESVEIPVGYRFTDADNDWVEGKILLTITGIDHPVSLTPQGSEIQDDADPLGPNCGVDAAGNAFARVFESGLDGQLAPRKASGTIAIEAPDGLESLYEPGKTNVFMGLPGSTGIGGRRVLTIYEDGSFEIGHSIAGDPKEGKIGITVIDADGSRAYGEFQVSQADVPTQKSYNHKEDDETHTASNWMHEIIGQTVDLGGAYVEYMDSYEIIQNGAHGTAYFVPKFEDDSRALDLVYRLDEAIDKRQFGYEHGNSFLRVDVDTIVVRYTAGGKDLYYTYKIDVFDHGPAIGATLDDGAPATWPGHVDVVFGGSVAGRWSHDFGPDTWGGDCTQMRHGLCAGRRLAGIRHKRRC